MPGILLEVCKSSSNNTDINNINPILSGKIVESDGIRIWMVEMSAEYFNVPQEKEKDQFRVSAGKAGHEGSTDCQK